jgi:hypothetical protein
MKNKIETDIKNWLINYVEANHEFYDYKFPPCPYARDARINAKVDICAWDHENLKSFITSQTQDLMNDKKFTVKIMVFPSKMRWYFHIHYFIKKLNKTLIPQDFYAQIGRAVDTKSKYNEFLKNKPYFIIIVNKLSDVLAAQHALSKTQYYSSWSPGHYNDVVVRRQKLFEKNYELD